MMKEFRIITLRECGSSPVRADSPDRIAEYWHRHIAPGIDAAREHAVVFLMNSRCRMMGHELVGMGTLTGVLLDARTVFRLAIVKAAHAIVLAHNHPSGDESPSGDDLKTTRQIARAGRVVGIRLMDHIIIGHRGRHASLKGLGYI